MGSFYDLDYIIKLNEERLEQYSNFYQKNIDKFTTILVLYSSFAIFFIPIVQSLFFETAKCHWLYHVNFYIFISLLSVSVVNTIRLLKPVEIAHLSEPQLYYKRYKYDYEDESIPQDEVDILIKSSYISELERAIKTNENIFKRKGFFYDRAFIYAISACIPYLICIGFQLSSRNNTAQKTVFINNFNNFNKTDYMAKKTEGMKVSDLQRGVDYTVPGVDSMDVISGSLEYYTVGLEVRFLWDNEVTRFIKKIFVKLFRPNKSQLK